MFGNIHVHPGIIGKRSEGYENPRRYHKAFLGFGILAISFKTVVFEPINDHFQVNEFPCPVLQQTTWLGCQFHRLFLPFMTAQNNSSNIAKQV
jgi:hypothetical protein